MRNEAAHETPHELSVDHAEVEKLGHHGFTTCMCLLCIDGLLRFGTCCPVQLVFIHCSTNCSLCYIRLVVMAVSIPAPLGLLLGFKSHYLLLYRA